MRLRSDFWVAAYIRTCEAHGAFAVVRRRGADSAGAILIRLDRRDGTHQLFGPAPQSNVPEDSFDRHFIRMHDVESIDEAEAEARIARELRFDPDVWIVEVEDRKGRSFLSTLLS